MKVVFRSVLGLCFMAFSGVALASGSDAAVLEKGKDLFLTSAVPACAICHTLHDAGATGAIGPNLDELKPDLESVKKVLIEGAGIMPSFADSLDEASRDAVAAYVVYATTAK